MINNSRVRRDFQQIWLMLAKVLQYAQGNPCKGWYMLLYKFPRNQNFPSVDAAALVKVRVILSGSNL